MNKKKHYKLLNYDKKRHLELLNKQSEEFQPKLRDYWIILFDHLNWEIRDQYLQLLEDYREEKLDILNFRCKFCERYESIQKAADYLNSNRVLPSPNTDKKSINFGDSLIEIDLCCNVYSNDPEPFRNEVEILNRQALPLRPNFKEKVKDYFKGND